MKSNPAKPVILLAEDDEDIVSLIHDALESFDCTVHTARDGAAALEIASRTSISLAILDIRMPFVDGVEVARRLRVDPATASVPTLILTASVGEDQEDLLRKAGADAMLAKPFEIREFRATVRALLGEAG